MVQLTAQLEPVLKYIKSGWDFAVGAKSIRLSAPYLTTGSVETAVEAKNLIRDLRFALLASLSHLFPLG